MSFWKPGIERAKNNQVRKEDGRYVKTIFGNDLYFPLDSDCFEYDMYDDVIKKILDNNEMTYSHELYGINVTLTHHILIDIDKQEKGRKTIFRIENPDAYYKTCIIFKDRYHFPYKTYGGKILKDDDYYRIVEHMGKHLSKRKIIDGWENSFALYHLGQYDYHKSNLLKYYMDKKFYNEGIEFIKIPAQTPEHMYDVCFPFNYKTSILYDEIDKYYNYIKYEL